MISFLQIFTDFLFPKICLSCRNKLERKIDISSEFCCQKCLNSFEIAPSTEEIENGLITFFQDSLAISRAIALYASHSEDENIAIMRLIYKLKYGGFTKIGTEFGRKLAEVLEKNKMLDYDLIIPVPIHKARRRERGYNQSDFIANSVGEVIRKPVAYNIIERKIYTTTQTKLSLENRRKNIQNVFQLKNKSNVQGMKILLIDDVLTTGSTINSCATVLLENKAKQVDVATIVKV